jgi:hypothetical protein
VAALVALLVGGAVATGIWWLTDNDVDILPDPATHVIVSPSVETGAGVAAKNEAGVAAAVGSGLIQQRFGAQATNTDANPLGDYEPKAPASRTDTESVEVNPSTGQAVPSARYDGGPEEGTRGPLAGAQQGP